MTKKNDVEKVKKGKQTLVCKEYNNIWVCTERGLKYAEALTLDWLKQPAETEGTE